MGQTITLTASDGFQLGAYRADPAGAPKAAIVVIQEIFGVNSHIRNVRSLRRGRLCRDCAGDLRPHREELQVRLYARRNRDGAQIHRQIPMDQMLLDTQAAIDAVKDKGPIGIVGFCLGGSIAFAAATSSTACQPRSDITAAPSPRTPTSSRKCRCNCISARTTRASR